MADRDYYDILGLKKSASADEVRTAHRRLVRKLHPDVNKSDPKASEKFQEVQEAYDALSDPEKRKQYDEFGRAGPIPNNPYAGAAAGARTPYGWSSDGGGGHVEEIDPADFGGGGGGGAAGNGQFSDIFEQLFNQRGPFNRGRAARGPGGRPSPMPDDFASAGGAPAGVEYPVTLTFEQAARGTTLPLSLQRGQRTETLDVKIPPGVKTGSRVRLKGRGSVGPNGPGDLFVIVQVQDHPYFRRDGLDIAIDVPISVYEAMLGTTLSVPTLEGRVTITIPAGTSSGAKLRIKGAGVTRGAEKGDQFCLVKVVVPKNLDPTSIGCVEMIRQNHPLDPRADVKW